MSAHQVIPTLPEIAFTLPIGKGERKHMEFKRNCETVLQELDTVLHKIDNKEIDLAMMMISSADRIFFSALGRAGFMGKSFVMRLMHMGKEVYVVGETNTPNFIEKDLLIICSGSGETKQFLQIAEKAKAFGGSVLAFLGTPGSTLSRLADCSIVIQAPSKRQEDSEFQSVQPMASLFEQGILLAGDAMILTMMAQATGNADMFHKHSNLE